MPNWAITSVRVEGDTLQLQSLYNLMTALITVSSPIKPGCLGHGWYGYLVGALGCNYCDVSCRGEYKDLFFDKEDNRIIWYSEDAWSACTEVFAVIQAKFPKLKVYYTSEEDGCEYYATNDPTVQAELCRVSCLYNMINYTDYFATLKECFDYLSKEFSTPINNMDDVDALREKLEAEDEHVILSVNEFEYIELPTLSDDVIKNL
jgi:hypothetical protein